MTATPEKKEDLSGPPHPEPPPPLTLPDFALPAGTDPQLPELKKFASDVLLENTKSLHNSSQSLRRSYQALFLMYCTLFVIGLATAIAAIIKGFLATDAGGAIPALVLGGLSVGSFFTLFIVRPLESLERNTIFSSWVIVVLNTYWTQLLYFNDPNTIHKDLKDATDEVVDELSALADKHAAAIGKYAPLIGADRSPKSGDSEQPGPKPQ